MKSLVINLTLFKAAWLAAITTAAASMPALGALAILAAVGVHLVRTGNLRGELLLMGCAAAIGFVWESLLVATGLLQYDGGFFVDGLAPYWIVAMWVLFATTLNIGMRWLRRNIFVAAIAGAIGGPLSFFAGASAGAVRLSDPVGSLLVIAAGWAVLLPFMVMFAQRIDRLETQPAVT